MALWGKVTVYENGSIASHIEDSAFVPFHASHKFAHGHAPYRQQRWNNIDTEVVPTVKSYFGDEWEQALPILRRFDLEKHTNTYLICLSNGETKKLELTKALVRNPKTLILDNAFTGLDIDARALLKEMINQLIEDGVQVITTGIKIDEFPDKIKNILVLNGAPRIVNRESVGTDKSTVLSKESFEAEIPQWPDYSGNEIIKTQHLDLKYDEKFILHDINWTVKAGERWALLGHNGSGKTSLLNMIFADNPKAYLSDIELFGKKKGSGESIWDIKGKIGFISPEMHQYLPSKQKCVDVVCSGLFDTEGLYRKPSGYQTGLACRWLKTLGLEQKADNAFEELSASEQRLALFARTLIKTPPLLILDEPYQGLDDDNIMRLNSILDNVARNCNCAMIFVSHYQNEIPDCFTHTLRLKDGKVVESR